MRRGWMTRWAARLGYVDGIVMIVWQARLLAATVGGNSAVGRTAQHTANRPAGSGRARDHD